MLPLTLEIEGENAPAVAHDLRDWIHAQGLEGIEVSLVPGKPIPGKQGAALATGLLLLLKLKAVTELVGSLKTWIKVRKPKVKLTIKSGKKQFSLELENAKLDQEFIDRLSELVRETT